MRDKMRDDLREQNILLKAENKALRSQIEQLELPLEYPGAGKQLALENNSCAIEPTLI